MRELVEYLVKSLVEHPNQVEIAEEERGETLVLRVSVAASDVGKVIGRHGRIAQAIRNVVGAAAHLKGKRVLVDIDS
ncbi:MAG: KH domain-containing protein [Alicyclobacillus herbarius]|uniref:KH domain-containing protein n=1 Tax=Alicyclobacillus herbarius TaxID=122960 RepID=UPI00040142D9|nr:KH domain-containing protein [Alicyclobacillus herbarius]MCL6633369.1 KH domain-containing protein [Alicyclobacillus herbarius]